MKYNKIIVLGTGKLFLDCMIYISSLATPFIGYDTGAGPQKLTRIQAEKKQLPYFQKDFPDVCEDIRKEDAQILLLSIINPRIVPADILEKENILALNIHQAILPRYKGRNAEAWAIFNGDAEAGVTWHKMLPKVDSGEILALKKVPITEDTTSYGLFREQLRAAYESFLEFMPVVLRGEENYEPQQAGLSEFHYSYEAPNNGMLDLKWDGRQICRFLRAMDYGGLDVFRQIQVETGFGVYKFKSYRITRTTGNEEKGAVINGDAITICKPGYEITLLKCHA